MLQRVRVRDCIASGQSVEILLCAAGYAVAVGIAVAANWLEQAGERSASHKACYATQT